MKTAKRHVAAGLHAVPSEARSIFGRRILTQEAGAGCGEVLTSGIACRDYPS